MQYFIKWAPIAILSNYHDNKVSRKTQKSRAPLYLFRYFGNPAVCLRPCRLSAPPSRVVEYYRLSVCYRLKL